MKSKGAILRYLSKSRERFSQLYSVERIGVFGSFARDNASEDSDLDIIVEMREPTFDHYMDLKFEIEDALGIKVDL